MPQNYFKRTKMYDQECDFLTAVMVVLVLGSNARHDLSVIDKTDLDLDLD